MWRSMARRELAAVSHRTTSERAFDMVLTMVWVGAVTGLLRTWYDWPVSFASTLVALPLLPIILYWLWFGPPD